jgi:penicillin amidase
VRIDDLGMPHIYAQSDLDAFYGAGYQQATEHLWAIDINRRAAVGRLAEVFGEDRFSGDVQARTIDFQGVATKSLALMRAERPQDYNLVVAFVGGINRRIAEIQAGAVEAPPEYGVYGVAPEPLTPVDSIAIGMRIQFGFSSTLDFDLLYTVLGSLAPRAASLSVFRPVGDAFIMTQGQPTAGPPRQIRRARRPQPSEAALRQFAQAIVQYRRDLGVGEGSNGWVIHGDHTFNGRPILANDSHARLADPNVMDLLHINSADAGGAFDAMGMAFLGVPGVHVGRNAKVVWGATTNFADMLDLWDVNVNDEGALLGNTREPVQSRVEEIVVRLNDGSTETRELPVSWVEGRGIFIPGEMLPFPKPLVAQGVLMLAWPGMDGITDLFAFLDMDRAETADDFEAAIRLMRTGMQNWMGADANGWRYLSHGDVPDRGPIEGRPEAYQVLDASDPRTLWTGDILPDEQLPYLDGSQPFMASANNDPWGHTFDDDPLNDPFYYGSFYAPSYRAQRLKEVLPEMVAAGPLTLEQNQALQMETDSQMAPRMLPDLLLAVEAIPMDPDLEAFRDRPELTAAADVLAAWDGRHTTDSEAGALFRIWWEVLARNVLLDDMGPLYDAIAEEQPVYLAKFVLKAFELADEELLDGAPAPLMVQALSDTLALFGDDPPTWGDLHVARLIRPDRSTRDLVTPGADTSLNVAQSRCLNDEGGLRAKCASSVGAVYRMVTHFDDTGLPITHFNCPSCRPDGDQDWIDGVYRVLPFTRAEVEAATTETRQLTP